jgi:hypothetical protein
MRGQIVPMMNRMRCRLTGAAALALGFATACIQYTAPDFCLELDGPCSGSGYNYNYTTRFYVLGFPADRVDRTATPSGTYRGVLHVGDAFPLQLMLAIGDTTTGTGVPVQGVNWTLADSTAVRLENSANGAGILMALRPGRVTLPVVADHTEYSELWSCNDQKQCWPVTEIEVLP